MKIPYTVRNYLFANASSAEILAVALSGQVHFVRVSGLPHSEKRPKSTLRLKPNNHADCVIEEY